MNNSSEIAKTSLINETFNNSLENYKNIKDSLFAECSIYICHYLKFKDLQNLILVSKS